MKEVKYGRRGVLSRMGAAAVLLGSGWLSSCDGGNGQAVGATTVPSQPVEPPDPLASWYQGGFSGKSVAFWGNSTVSNAVYFFDQLRTHAARGGLLEGLDTARILNLGSNGASLAALLAGQGAFPVTAVIAARPDLLVIRGPLINDVRLGGASMEQASRLLALALDEIRAGSPGTAILLTTENSLLSVDAAGYGYVQPADAAQRYTDILHSAVMAMAGRFPNVRVLDVMGLLYGITSVPQSPLMADQIHPNEAGQRAEANLIAEVVGRRA